MAGENHHKSNHRPNHMKTTGKTTEGANGHRGRLRKRFLSVGIEGFAEHEVLELVLTLAIPRRDVKGQAKRLLNEFGSLRAVLDTSPSALQTVEGVGEAAATILQIIKAVAELYRRQELEQLSTAIQFDSLGLLWQMKIGSLQNEVFEVAYLDTAYKLLPSGIERLAEGTLNRSSVYARRVMEAAVRRQAAALVFAHNHPNGSALATEQDKLLTRALVLAAETLEIRVVDHLIVTTNAVFSFRNEGLL